MLNALPGHAASVLDDDREALAEAAGSLAALEEQVIARNGMKRCVLERGERLYAGAPGGPKGVAGRGDRAESAHRRDGGAAR